MCLLLRRHANQEIRDKDGRRPIDVAIDTAHADIVTLLRLQPLHSDSKVSSVVSYLNIFFITDNSDTSNFRGKLFSLEAIELL